MSEVTIKTTPTVVHLETTLQSTDINVNSVSVNVSNQFPENPIFNSIVVGDTTNNVTIDETGIDFNGTARYINEIHLPATAAHRLGYSDPEFTQLENNGAGSVGIYAPSFSGSQLNELQVSESLPDKYVEGTSIELYMRLYPESNNDGIILVDVEYGFCNVNDTIAHSNLVQVPITIPANSIKKHLNFLLLTISGTGIKPCAGFGMRIARRGDLVGDTHNADIWITRFIVKHLANKQ